MSWSIYDSPSHVRCTTLPRVPGSRLDRGPGTTWAAREARQRSPRPPRRVTPDVRQRRMLKLLREGRAPAHVLAAQLGIGLRTVYRDIEALRADGYVVLAVGGRRGGFWLAPDCRPAPLELTSEVLREIVVGLAAAAQRGVLPTTPDARAFLDGLLVSVPEERARWLRRLCDGLLAEARPYGLTESSLAALEKSMGESRILSVCSKQGGKVRTMAVEPRAFELGAEGFVLSGWDRRGLADVEVPLSTVTSARTGHWRVPRAEPLSRRRLREAAAAKAAASTHEAPSA